MTALARHKFSIARETLHIASPAGVTVQCDRHGSGPPLVLVHGSFSNHISNWSNVAAMLAEHFTLYMIARRGRGSTDVTEDHGLIDEGSDVAAVVRKIDEPVFLLGHSYGAQVALFTAAEAPERVRRLVLYEPPRPGTGADVLARLEALGQDGDWDGLAFTFFRDVFSVPAGELEPLRASELWPPIVADAEASLGDVRAMNRSDIHAGRFRGLPVPVVLQIGTESPRDFFHTDTLAGVLPDVLIEALEGQAHEGMATAPEQYAEAVRDVLLG